MQNLDLNPRFAALGGYPFARLRSLLDGLSPPDGQAPIDMTIGEPRRPVPPLVGEVLARQGAGFGKYPPTRGSLGLRQAFAAWLTRRYGLPPAMIDPDRHVMALNGTREGLFQIALVCVPPQRNGAQPAVLIPNPFYQCYAGAAAAAGAEPVFLPATPATGHLPDLEALPPALLDRTALFYLCSPANPQGAAAPADYWRRLLALARQHGFVVAADECYAEIYRSEAPSGALEAAAESGALDNLVVFHSLSKRSGVPGLRGGICAGDPAILDHFTILRSYARGPCAAAPGCGRGRTLGGGGACDRDPGALQCRLRPGRAVAGQPLCTGRAAPGRGLLPLARCRRRRGDGPPAVDRGGAARAAGRLSDPARCDGGQCRRALRACRPGR